MQPQKPEWWVMRVLLNKLGTPVKLREMDDATYTATMALVRTGELALVPSRDGTGVMVAEPVMGFEDDQASADALCEKMARDNPGQDYRLILNADV